MSPYYVRIGESLSDPRDLNTDVPQVTNTGITSAEADEHNIVKNESTALEFKFEDWEEGIVDKSRNERSPTTAVLVD
ncbi:hypothetical protein GJ496_006000 [Pomphorhynchus laevis]|nr:hypothetical protein GJ496_006000 [Pomphorhynchus laevis]